MLGNITAILLQQLPNTHFWRNSWKISQQNENQGLEIFLEG